MAAHVNSVAGHEVRAVPGALCCGNSVVPMCVDTNECRDQCVFTT